MTDTTTANWNHIKLSRLHIGLATAYAFLFGSMYFFKLGGLTESGKLVVNILSVSMPLFHISLAWGCKNKSEISRRISQIVGFLMLFLFPMGTVFGFFLIRFADWESFPDEKAYAASANKMQSSLHRIGIEYISLRKTGIVLSLISPLTFALILADVGLGIHILSPDMVMGGHYLAIGGMLTLTPIGLILLFIGDWIGSRKNRSEDHGNVR
jgi:hypothetical protein